VEPQIDRLDVTPTSTGWLVAGEVDAVSAQQLEEVFADLPAVGAGSVEVDLAAVTFIDSSGLRVLLGLADRAEAAGASTVIRNPSTPVIRLLTVTQLGSRFGLG